MIQVSVLIFIVCSTRILWASLVLPGGLRMGLITYLMALFIHACCIVTLRIGGLLMERIGGMHAVSDQYS